MAEARDRLTGARHALSAGDFAVATSAAYYAMLYGARAALSERDLYAKTHSGVWSRFREQYVTGGEFDPKLSSEASRAQRTRELGDYEAKAPNREQAEDIVGVAARFLTEIERVLGE